MYYPSTLRTLFSTRWWWVQGVLRTKVHCFLTKWETREHLIAVKLQINWLHLLWIQPNCSKVNWPTRACLKLEKKTDSCIRKNIKKSQQNIRMKLTMSLGNKNWAEEISVPIKQLNANKKKLEWITMLTRMKINLVLEIVIAGLENAKSNLHQLLLVI